MRQEVTEAIQVVRVVNSTKATQRKGAGNFCLINKALLISLAITQLSKLGGISAPLR